MIMIFDVDFGLVPGAMDRVTSRLRTEDRDAHGTQCSAHAVTAENQLVGLGCSMKFRQLGDQNGMS